MILFVVVSNELGKYVRHTLWFQESVQTLETQTNKPLSLPSRGPQVVRKTDIEQALSILCGWWPFGAAEKVALQPAWRGLHEFLGEAA